MSRYTFDTVIERRGTDSKKWDAYPADILPMWIADSDFLCPQEVLDALAAHLACGAFGYANGGGRLEQAAALWMRKRFGWDTAPESVLYVPTLGTALAVAVLALTEPGDNVLIQTPLYPPFSAAVRTNGRTPVAAPLTPVLTQQGTEWHVDFDALERHLANPKTTLFLLCNPHNPTGKVFTETELRTIGDLCRKHGVRIFSDEIHCDYVHPGHRHIPFPTLGGEYAALAAVGINPSKTFNIADLQTAALIIPDQTMRQRYATVLTSLRFNLSAFGVAAFATAYEHCDTYADEVRAYTEANIDYAVARINANIPGIRAYKPDATYLLWLDCRELAQKLGGYAPMERFFQEKAKVMLNYGSSFGEEGKGYMRLNLACPRALVTEGLHRIENAVNAL